MERIRNRIRGVAGKNRMASLIIPCIAIIVIATIVAMICIIVTSKMNTDTEKPFGQMAGDEKMAEKKAEKRAAKDVINCPGLEGEKLNNIKCCEYDPTVTKGPACSMLRDNFGFEVKNVSQQGDGKLIQLKFTKKKTPYGPSFKKVDFKLTYLTENILRFQFKDAEEERYEVPVQKDFPLLQNQTQNQTEVNWDNLTYEVVHTNESEIFNFAVIRKTDGTVLWNTSLGALILTDKLLQIGSYLPSEYIYGLGEHSHKTLKHNMDFVSWPMFARDEPPNPKKRANLYGVHPFYTCLERSGASHGVLLLNSNAMEVMMLPAPGIIFRTIGGILDFFIFVGDNPEHVIQLYTSLIGRPVMPPYWSLGFQLSRYGYDNIQNLTAVMERTTQAGIPQAVQFLDIDHLDKRMDFTYDNFSFDGLPEYIRLTKNDSGLKWIIILDPAIAAVDSYEPYTSGVSQSVYVMRGPSWKKKMFPSHLRQPNVVYGKVWPPDFVAFPDFFRNETKAWWKEQIVKHKETIDFDGLWIDMNEPANFDTDKEVSEDCNEKNCWNLVCPENELDDPPFNPQKESGFPRLSTKTLCMQSVHTLDDKEYRHYDLHSLYGWSQTQPTLEAAQEATGTRSLVISRSTYPSSGRYAGTWLGDNKSDWHDLKVSVIGILEYNMFGIPYVGADVCGFFGVPSEELCMRWMQLGAFYPFYRNHNNKDTPDQDPASFSEEVAEISKKAVERRISLNPYLYTLFFRAHKDGSTVVRPVFHEFPKDNFTWDIDTTFMWGKSLLIAPILLQGKKGVFLYLPKTEWWKFDFEKTHQVKATGRTILDTDAEEYTPVYVRGGSILPIEIYESGKMPDYGNNTANRRFNIYIFPQQGVAEGELFIDDGVSKDTIENGSYVLYDFKVTNCTLKTTTVNKNHTYKGTLPFLEKVFVYKAKSVTNSNYNKNVIPNEKLKVATVTVQTAIDKLEELEWYDSNRECVMFE